MMRLKPTVTLSRVDDETVLLDSASGKYFGLNAVGSRFVELLLGTSGEQALAEAAQEYDAPEAQIRADFQRLIESLRSKGLLHEESE